MQAPEVLTPATDVLSLAIMHLGPRIRQERQKREWSLRELARRAGVSSAAVSLIETEKRETPGVETVKAIADALGVTVDALLADDAGDTLPAAE